jgi:hypothetical protein
MLIQKGQIMNDLMENVLQLDETFIVQDTFFNDIPAMQSVIHTFLPETCLIKPSARHKLFLNVERVSNFVKLRKQSTGNSGQL